MLLFLPDSGYSPVHRVCRHAAVVGNVWPMLEGEEAQLTSASGGWCLVSWALRQYCCQTPRPSLLLPEPTDQTIGPRLSKPISSWREEHAHCKAVIQFTGKKEGHKALCQCVHAAVSYVLSASHHVNICVLFTDLTWAAMSASGGSLQIRFHVPLWSKCLE